jgi:hypothetical protein
MSERTPTTEQVRSAYSYDPEADYHDPLTNHTHQHEREFDRWLAAHDERVRTEERERLIGNLRWLAKSRAEYCRLPHGDEDVTIRAYHESTRPIQVLHDEHTIAESLADVLGGSDDYLGWLPSWRWDEWLAIRAVSAEQEDH